MAPSERPRPVGKRTHDPRHHDEHEPVSLTAPLIRMQDYRRRRSGLPCGAGAAQLHGRDARSVRLGHPADGMPTAAPANGATTAGDPVETGIGRRHAPTGRAGIRPVARPASAQSAGDTPGRMHACPIKVVWNARERGLRRAIESRSMTDTGGADAAGPITLIDGLTRRGLTPRGNTCVTPRGHVGCRGMKCLPASSPLPPGEGLCASPA